MNISKSDFIKVLEGDRNTIRRSEELLKIGIYGPKEKVCKNCGKLFIPRGNYKTNYCDRIPEGQKHTCKYLGAVANRRDKVASDEKLQNKQREYKKMYARMTNGKITREEFNKWKLGGE